MKRLSSNEIRNTTTYTLHHFMKYPNLAFKLAMVVPFKWCESNYNTGGAICYMKHIWFVFGALNLIYQNFGMLIYLFLPRVQPGDVNEPIMGQISETGGIMGLTLVGSCKMFMLFWHGERISNLMDEFQHLFPTSKIQSKHVQQNRRFQRKTMPVYGRYHLDYFSRKSNTLMRRTTIFFIFAFCVYNSLPVVEFIYEQLSSKHQLKYRYQSNTWYPWQARNNAQSFISFLAAYLCQVQSSLTGVAFIMGGEFMLSFFITQMQMHLDYLANALELLDARITNANEQLKYLINYHNRLLRLSKEVNHIFNISFMINFFTSSIAICLMSLSMVMISAVHAFKYSVGLLSFLVFTLFICYNGSEFTKSSDLLMPAAFYNNWYEGNLAYRKMILFFIMRSGQPNVLKAYKFTTVSMQTYMAILKSSYQLFTFFRTMY